MRRRLAGLAVAAVLGAATVVAPVATVAPSPDGPLGAPPAQAIDHSRGTPGYCPDDRGVTVVVDFQQLGSRQVVVRCAPNVTASSTGLDAFYDAGFEIEGTRRWGEGFICRIENVPDPGTDIPVNGDPHYREPCIDTPPSLAYWSYWHSPDGGSWAYSQWGVKNRTIIPGGFEGWSFSLNATETTNPPPRVAPSRPAAAPSPTPPPAPAPGAPHDPVDPDDPPAAGAPEDTGGAGSGQGAAHPGSGTGSGSNPAPTQDGDRVAAGSQQHDPDSDSDSDSDVGADSDSDAAAVSADTDERTEQPTSAGAIASADDTSATSAGPVVTGGEHLASARTEAEGRTWLGVPVSLWLTAAAVLGIMTGGAAIARRRSMS